MANEGQMEGGVSSGQRSCVKWWNRLIELWRNPLQIVMVAPPLEKSMAGGSATLSIARVWLEPVLPGMLTTTLARGGNAMVQLYEAAEDGDCGPALGDPIKVRDTKMIPTAVSPLPIGCGVHVARSTKNRLIVIGYDCDEV